MSADPFFIDLKRKDVYSAFTYCAPAPVSVSAMEILHTRSVKKWEFTISDHKLRHTHIAEDQAQQLISNWTQCFPYESTWVQKNVGLPSILIRLDMVVTPRGIEVFEVEERPAGFALLASISSRFRLEFRQMIDEWELAFGRKIGVVVSTRRRSGEEELMQNVLDLRVHRGVPKEDSGVLYIVRAEPEESDYHCLQDRSISTLLTKGMKDYGVPLHLWRHVPDDVAELPWSTGFALKPHQGSKMHGTFLYHPSLPPGSVSRTRVESLVRNKQVEYVQDWIEPEHHSFLPKDYFLVRRIFWGWSPQKAAWKCMGGPWVARSNVRVHGATDAIVGEVETR